MTHMSMIILATISKVKNHKKVFNYETQCHSKSIHVFVNFSHYSQSSESIEISTLKAQCLPNSKHMCINFGQYFQGLESIRDLCFGKLMPSQYLKQ